MKKRISLFLLAAVLFTLSCGPAAGEPAQLFADVQSHWAAGDIEQCSIFRLMSGYPENLFMPDRTLSKAEAMVVIGRSLGWDRQAGDISYGGIEFPDNLWEGYRKYVVLAADKQLIVKGDIPGVSFNDPATRLEMVIWMARALNLSGNGAGLTFKDLGEVPVRFRDMLAGVVEAGIIKGLPGNLLNPSGTLTRGEMAVILSRLLDSDKISPPYGSRVKGKISPGDRTQNKISVVTASGSNTYELSGSFSAYRNGSKSDLSAFEAGESVKLSLDEAGKCALIINDMIYSGPAAGERGYVSGKYRDYFTVHIDYGKVVKVQVADVTLLINGDSTVYGSLKPGAPVELLRTGTAITAVNIKDGTPKIFGRVKDVTTGSIVIKDENGNTAFYDMATRAKIVDIYGVETDVSGIVEGMIVELWLDNNQKVREILLHERTLEGKVEELDKTVSNRITVTENGIRRFYYFAEGVTVRDSSGSLRLEDIKKGMDIRITLDAGNRVTGLEVTDMSTVEGNVIKVNTSGMDQITIRERNGYDKTYYVADGATIREGRGILDLDDIKKDTGVRLTLGSSSLVTGIEITDLSTVVGYITGIGIKGTKWIVLDSDRSRQEIYYINDNAVVSEGILTRSLSFIQEGMRVRLTLDVQGRVNVIDVIGLRSLEGEIIDVQAPEVKKITVKDKNGQERAFYLAEGAVAAEGGRAINLGELKAGMIVYLTLDNIDRVVKVEVPRLWAVDGEVDSINNSGLVKLEIKKSDGSKGAYYLNDGIVIRESGIKRNLWDIVRGVRVRLNIEDGNITGIDIVGMNTAEGTVKQTTAKGMKKIEIDNSGNKGGVYDIDDNVLVRQGEITLDLDHVFEGMRVRMILDSNGYATRIDIL